LEVERKAECKIRKAPEILNKLAEAILLTNPMLSKRVYCFSGEGRQQPFLNYKIRLNTLECKFYEVFFRAFSAHTHSFECQHVQ
jgi:hypothetical protein